MISRIQYITNGKSADAIIQEVQDVLAAGVDWIQLRIKDDNLDFKSIASEVKSLCDSKATFIINDRVDVAIEVDADGVHLGQEDMSPSEARNILGPDKIVGGTANTLLHCKNLELEGVDYIGLGPFAHTSTKEKLSPILGLEGIQEILPADVPYEWVSISVSKPVVAIGGIQVEDIDDIMSQTSVHGIAVSSLIGEAEDKKLIVEQIKESVYGSVENS